MALNVYATKANMDKYHPKYGNSLVMFSPYTGEQYSANPGDYWMASPSKQFKDTTGHVMRLVVKRPGQLRQLTVSKRKVHPKVKRR